MPFQPTVARTPSPKQGSLLQRKPDGSFVTVALNLVWPSLQCSGGENVDIANVVVHRRPGQDGIANGRNVYCFQCVSRSLGGNTHSFYAATPQERDAWSSALRQHAAFHNLANAFDKSRKVLGTGSYASVYLGKDKCTGNPVALKIIPRSRIDALAQPAAERQLLAEEVRLGRDQLRHELCTKTTEFIENVDQYVIVMELMGGGDLFEFIRRRNVTEGEVQCITRQVLTGLAHMHQQGVGHFDIKPENFLLSSEKPMTVKLCDFGIATRAPASCFKAPGMLRATPGYAAPEIVRQQGSAGLKADVWSMGVCVYFLLTKIQPFLGSSEQDTVNRMSSGEFDASALSRCSPQAKDFIARALTVDQNRRMSVSEALNHPWITSAPQLSTSPPAGGCFVCLDPWVGKAFKSTAGAGTYR